MSEENQATENAQEIQTAVPGISPYYKTIDGLKEVTAIVHAEDDGSFSVFKRPALEQQPVHIVLANLNEVQAALAGQLVPSTPTEFEDMLVNQWGYNPQELREDIPATTAQDEAERDAIDANNAENNLVQTNEEGTILPEGNSIDAPDVGSDAGATETDAADEAILNEKLDEIILAYGADDFEFEAENEEEVIGTETIVVLYQIDPSREDGTLKEIARGTLSELEDNAPKPEEQTATE
jgi:hypothetical protein